MKNNFFQKKILYLGIVVILASGVLIGVIIFSQKNIDQRRSEFIKDKESIVKELIAEGEYTCCLEKPCTYCIEKTPKHGEGATCSCLEDVILGKHPCGECIGEILEGHGNRFLAKYFARSIAEELGEKYLEIIKQIISEKYGISIKEQL